MLRELIVSRDMSVASHWSVIARGHGARQIHTVMQSMDPALLLTLWLCFKCEWKGRFMNPSVIVEQRLKRDVLGNREWHLHLLVARSSGVSFLASGTRLVLSMFGRCCHRLCCKAMPSQNKNSAVKKTWSAHRDRFFNKSNRVQCLLNICCYEHTLCCRPTTSWVIFTVITS